MKKFSIILISTIVIIFSYSKIESFLAESADKYHYLEAHPIVESAREQIGVINKYDTSYYQGGYPPFR